MAKPEWGRKRTCQVCGKKFYDLNKSPIICPCPEAVEFDPNDYLKSRKGKDIPPKALVENDNDLTKIMTFTLIMSSYETQLLDDELLFLLNMYLCLL